MEFFYVLLVTLFLIFLGSFFGTPWLPTRRRDFERIAQLANLRPGQLFCDLGSGTGELLFYLSKYYKVRCVGIEVSPFLYLYSKIKSLFYRDVKILYGSYYKYNLSDVDVVYIFLLPKNFIKIREKFSKELKESSRMIISSWQFKDVHYAKASEAIKGITYYLYNKKDVPPL